MVQERAAQIRIFAAVYSGRRGCSSTEQVRTYGDSDRRKRGGIDQVGHMGGSNRRATPCGQPKRGAPVCGPREHRSVVAEIALKEWSQHFGNAPLIGALLLRLRRRKHDPPFAAVFYERTTHL